MLAPVRIDGHELAPRDEIHQRKLETLRVFVQRLLASPARDQIAKVILFGSVARGEARADSDVDVMIYGFGNLKPLEAVSADSAYALLLESSEYIAPMVENASELFEPQSYLNYRVAKFGLEAFAMSDEMLRKREIQDRKLLAEEYLRASEDAARNGHLRLAADGAYNAAETCAKALLLLKLDEPPTSHSGIVQKFSEHFVKNGPAPRELGGRLNRGLIIRGDARYKPGAQIGREQVEHNLALAKEMILLAESFVDNL